LDKSLGNVIRGNKDFMSALGISGLMESMMPSMEEASLKSAQSNFGFGSEYLGIAKSPSEDIDEMWRGFTGGVKSMMEPGGINPVEAISGAAEPGINKAKKYFGISEGSDVEEKNKQSVMGYAAPKGKGGGVGQATEGSNSEVTIKVQYPDGVTEDAVKVIIDGAIKDAQNVQNQRNATGL
jgi:hypothetical protein